MAYENVTLPDLPDYDYQSYPFAIMVLNYELDATDYYSARFFYSSRPFVYNSQSGTITNTEGVSRFCYYEVDYGTWSSEYLFTEGSPEITIGQYDSVYQRIWTKMTMYDENGETYLLAGQVTPIPDDGKFDLKSWLTGFVLALAGKPLGMGAGKTPVAYLYNGIRLPALPEWDKVKYPYACIFNYYHDEFDGSSAYLALLPEIVHYHGTLGDGTPYTAIDQTGMVLYTFAEFAGDTQWNYYPDTEYYKSIIPYGDVVWANFDVVDEAGTKYLSASAPVPVYK